MAYMNVHSRARVSAIATVSCILASDKLLGQMAAALMALNQSSSAATIGSAGAGAGGLPTTGMQGIGGEVSADSIDWAAVQVRGVFI